MENQPSSSSSSMPPGPPLTHPTHITPSSTHLTPHPRQATNSDKSSDGRTSDGARAIVVEDSDEEESDNEGSDKGEVTDEDDDAKLGMWSNTLLALIDIGQLARLQKDWDAPIYVFFKPLPSIEYIHNRKAHVFECAASQCHCRTRFVRRFLDTGDAKSTSNLRRHAKTCWSEEAVEVADGTRDIKTARAALQNLKSVNGSITAAFQRVGEKKAVYSHRQHTKTEAQYARFICSSDRR